VSQPGKKAQGLGAELRKIRKERVGRSMASIAEQLGWSESKISRMETGQQPITSEEAASLLAILGVVGDEHAKLMAMARTPNDPAWLDNVRDGLPEESITLATYESEATRLTNWSPLLVPGLLSTLDYSRAFMLADRVAEPDIGKRLMARAKRQEQVLGSGVEYRAYIDETVLRFNRVGDDQILRNQLRHLLEVGERDNVTIRLISVNSDGHSGLISPFMMIEFELTPPVVHVELSRSGVFLSNESETAPYRETLAQLSSISMDEADSLRAIEAMLREKGSGR
jgi:transcriptional regulator with XRE-family HTH domain